jgi:hypothetical protein
MFPPEERDRFYGRFDIDIIIIVYRIDRIASNARGLSAGRDRGYNTGMNLSRESGA